jgi:hypothetical protein
MNSSILSNAKLEFFLSLYTMAVFIANLSVLFLYILTAIKVPKVKFIWVLIAGNLPYLLLSLLNIFLQIWSLFGCQMIPRKEYMRLYFSLLAFSPIGSILVIIGTAYLSRYIIKSEKKANK